MTISYHPAKRLSKEIIMDRPIAFHQLSFLAQRFIERQEAKKNEKPEKDEVEDSDDDS